MNGSTPVDKKKSAGEPPEPGTSGEPRAVSAGEPLSPSAVGPLSAPAVGPRPASAGDTPAGSAGAQRVLSGVETRPARLNVAALRRAVPIRMWGGKGSGLPCDFCRVLVGPEDVEYEVEAQLDGATVMLRFHYRCHYAWTGGEEPLVAADRA